MSAIAQIRALLDRPRPYYDVPAGLAELQLEAAREQFAAKRGAVRVLDRRAREAGIDEIRSLSDLVPLLFSHTNYKSYPESFVDRGQWANMNTWFQTLTSKPVTGVDVEGVRDADDWMERLTAAGHFVYASSGTSGKCSFIDQSQADVDAMQKAFEISFLTSWAPIVPASDRIAYLAMPQRSPHRHIPMAVRFLREKVAQPGKMFFISDEPMLANQGIRAGQMRRALAAGTATPGEIAAYEAETAAKAARMQETVATFIDQIAAHRHEPQGLMIPYAQLYRVVEGLKARGIPDGDFHPDTLISSGSGTKGVKLPEDFKQQITKFFALPQERFADSYGMVEMTGFCPMNYDHGAYMFPPWVIPLVLDKSGEHLLNPADGSGKVEGRMALFDLLADARWGGVISGDKVEAQFAPGDGIAGPLIRFISRYQDLEEGEDKLSCAGTIDAYVRGEININA